MEKPTVSIPGLGKIEIPDIDSFERAYLNKPEHYMCNQLFKKLDDYIVEGLKRKGFVFNNKIELESFVRDRCRCEDNIKLKQKVYYVDDKPFFLHKYKNEIITDPRITGDPLKVVGSLGSFSYL